MLLRKPQLCMPIGKEKRDFEYGDHQIDQPYIGIMGDTQWQMTIMNLQEGKPCNMGCPLAVMNLLQKARNVNK